MKLILLGAPGAGKGTQAEIIAERLSVPIISTGNILKEAVREGTELGLKAKSFMDKGELVPDELIIGIVSERLAQPDCADGFILDGVPRTVAQAEALEEMGVVIDRVVNIDVPDEIIVPRITGRRSCRQCGSSYHVEFKTPKQEGVCDKCGGELVTRSDDEESTVKNRLRVYHETTEQLIDYYSGKGKLREVNGDGEMCDITRAILEALEA
ncbi:MAG: adenylate kinase [Oscillospiraceae bacterium]|nr:adenylate kinase [Oscillospiraceae bacterium]